MLCQAKPVSNTTYSYANSKLTFRLQLAEFCEQQRELAYKTNKNIMWPQELCGWVVNEKDSEINCSTYLN